MVPILTDNIPEDHYRHFFFFFFFCKLMQWETFEMVEAADITVAFASESGGKGLLKSLPVMMHAPVH